MDFNNMKDFGFEDLNVRKSVFDMQVITLDTPYLGGLPPELEKFHYYFSHEGPVLMVIPRNYLKIALESGDLDANYFQHLPYLESFNKENGTNLVSAGAIHYEPFGVYAGKTTSLDELQDGATIAVPNDTTNEARALLLLEAQGLIKLKEDAGLTATKNDIVENPKNLQLYEVEAAQLPRVIGDVDVAVINGNYAIEAGYKVSDALAVEASDSLAATTYGNVVAVRAGEENDPAIQALIEALTSDEVKAFIESTYDGAVVPLF